MTSAASMRSMGSSTAPRAGGVRLTSPKWMTSRPSCPRTLWMTTPAPTPSSSSTAMNMTAIPSRWSLPTASGKRRSPLRLWMTACTSAAKWSTPLSWNPGERRSIPTPVRPPSPLRTMSRRSPAPWGLLRRRSGRTSPPESSASLWSGKVMACSM